MSKIKIGITSYGMFGKFIDRIRAELPEDAELVVLNDVFEDLKKSVRKIEASHSVDVFIGSGGNGEFLSRNLKSIPLVMVKVTGFDVMEALHEVRRFNDVTGLITHRDPIPELAQFADVLSINIDEAVYREPDEVDDILQVMFARGIRDVIGGSYVLDRAHIHGMRGHYIWTYRSIREAVTTAVNLARTMRLDQEKAKKFDSILKYASEGILLTDRDGRITDFNDSAERILNRSRDEVIGKDCRQVLPNTHLHQVMETRRSQYNKIQDLGNVKIVTNRSPIISEGEVIGALATFFSVNHIKEAEISIRQSQFRTTGFPALTFDNMTGSSAAVTKLRETGKQYAISELPILITGGSCSDPAPLAQSIHNCSARKNQPLLIINCGAYSAAVLERELFGYEDGAVAGVRKGGHSGFIESAHRGTLFLENVHELSLPLQTRLSQVLASRQVLRIGSTEPIPVDIRLITSTDRDIRALAEKSLFRKDLMLRLSVLTLSLPKLKDRSDDLPELIASLLPSVRGSLSHSEINKISRLQSFLDHSWPGELLELRATLERFCLRYKPTANLEELARQSILQQDSPVLDAEAFDREERQRLEQALKLCGGNRERAAAHLNISRTTLWRKLKEYGIGSN